MRSSILRSGVAFATLLLTWICSGHVQAGESYYVLVYGSQRMPNDPNYTHTWATLVRATWEGDGPCPVNPTIEEHTISWLPCNGIVRVHALLPEPGRNWGLHETMRWCLANEMRISLWGAYRIDRDLYDRGLAHLRLLESGRVLYKAADMGRSSDRVSNCTHSVSSIAEGHRLRVATPGWGEMASYYVLLRFDRWIRDHRSQDWIAVALGLDQYPIIYRDFSNPFSGALLGPGYRLLGGERDLQATFGPPAR